MFYNNAPGNFVTLGGVNELHNTILGHRILTEDW
jgi:hypothetical protein